MPEPTMTQAEYNAAQEALKKSRTTNLHILLELRKIVYILREAHGIDLPSDTDVDRLLS